MTRPDPTLPFAMSKPNDHNMWTNMKKCLHKVIKRPSHSNQNFRVKNMYYIRALALGGVNTSHLLFYIQNIKNCPTSRYGFLKNFATCEQWVLIYRTYCSLGCKNIIIILIENENLLSPHLPYTVQVTNHTLLFSLILFISITLFPLSTNYKSSIAHAQSLSFPMTFFLLFIVLLYPQTEESRVIGLILSFFWNFWVSRWSMLPPRFWVCSFLVARSAMEQVGIFFPLHCIALSPN